MTATKPEWLESPVHFDPFATCPNFDELLALMFDSVAKRDLLLEAMAYMADGGRTFRGGIDVNFHGRDCRSLGSALTIYACLVGGSGGYTCFYPMLQLNLSPDALSRVDVPFTSWSSLLPSSRRRRARLYFAALDELPGILNRVIAAHGRLVERGEFTCLGDAPRTWCY